MRYMCHMVIVILFGFTQTSDELFVCVVVHALQIVLT